MTIREWIKKKTKRKPPPLHRAIEAGDTATMRKLCNPRRVRAKDSFQRNALHIAAMHEPTLEWMQYLVRLYPDGVSETDKVGRLPLHAACSHNASTEVIDFLLKQDSESMLETTDRGSTPLFCALESKTSNVPLVAYLIQEDADVMHLNQYKLGKTPVHAAVTHGCSLPVIELLLSHRPQAISERDAWGKTPLACAVAHHPDDAVVNFFLNQNAVAIQQTDRGGMLPLHIGAAHTVRTAASMEVLLDAYPKAIHEPDNNGRLPLHAACTNQLIDLEVLIILKDAYPEALRTFDKMGACPLHLAIQRKLPAEIINYLIDEEVGAVRTREASTRMYPLHLACKAGVDPTIVDKLTEIFPQAVDAVDKNGNTVFHVACMHRQLTLEFAEKLLSICSAEMIRKPNEDEALPLHMACAHRAPLDVLYLLIDYHPAALDTKDRKGNVPLHRAFQTNTEMSVLVRLAKQNHHALNRVNKRGLTPEDCANELFVKRFRRARYWFNLRKAYCPICVRKR